MKINKDLFNIYRKDTIEKSERFKEMLNWYDNYKMYPMNSLMSNEDIGTLTKLASSPSMHCNVKEMYRLMDELMLKRGFKMLAGGTNRRIYQFLYDQRLLAKISTDNVYGFVSNIHEMEYQRCLKPFCAKTFELSNNAYVALSECLIPIKDKSEFIKYSEDIFDILYFMIRNNDIALDDIGTRSFKNWGYRNGFGPALLDYANMRVADPKKRFCWAKSIDGSVCGGTLDYDDGFNKIICTSCGASYDPSAISKPDGEETDVLYKAFGITKNEGVRKMGIHVKNKATGEIVFSTKIGGTSNYIDPFKSNLNGGGTVKVNDKVTFTKPQKKIGIHSKPKNEGVSTVAPERYAVTINALPDERKNKLIDMFNKLNAGMSYQQVVGGKPVGTDDFIEAFKKSVVNPSQDAMLNDIIKLYKKVSAATMNTEQITDNDIATADTMLNTMLRKISNAGPNDNMAVVFYKLVKTVKNAKIFFEAIANFWTSMLNTNAIDITERSEYDIYCVYKEVIDTFRHGIEMALYDFAQNIALSSVFEYNPKSILMFIKSTISDMKFMNASIEEDIANGINVCEFYTITMGTSFAEMVLTTEDRGITINGTAIETKDDDSTDEDEEESEPEEKPISPVEQYNNAVIGNEKQGTNKQQNRYDQSGKKNKKKHRR